VRRDDTGADSEGVAGRAVPSGDQWENQVRGEVLGGVGAEPAGDREDATPRVSRSVLIRNGVTAYRL
jgi:hypothetical protein